MKYSIIDNRMRECEKEYLKSLGYYLIEIPKSHEVYPEISSHVDIFVCQINHTIFAEKSVFDHILCKRKGLKRSCHMGETKIRQKLSK